MGAPLHGSTPGVKSKKNGVEMVSHRGIRCQSLILVFGPTGGRKPIRLAFSTIICHHLRERNAHEEEA
jgi:hypothetical protein